MTSSTLGRSFRELWPETCVKASSNESTISFTQFQLVGTEIPAVTLVGFLESLEDWKVLEGSPSGQSRIRIGLSVAVLDTLIFNFLD